MIDEMIFNIHEIKTYEFKIYFFGYLYKGQIWIIFNMQKKDLKTSINYEFSLYLDL